MLLQYHTALILSDMTLTF